jgi:hypothetical protein
VILDLPAEEVGRKQDSVDASSAEDFAGAADQQGIADPVVSAEAGAETSSIWDTPPAGGQGAESSFASSDPQSSLGHDGGHQPGVASATLAPAPKRRTSFAALLTAGLIGGAVAGGGLYALDRSGVLPLGIAGGGAASGVTDPGVDVAAEVARLEAQIAEVRQAGTAATPEPVDIAPLREQIAALEQGVAELRQQPPVPRWTVRGCRRFRTALPSLRKPQLPCARRRPAGLTRRWTPD